MNREEVHGKVKCRAEMLRAEKILQFKGLSMGKARGLHGPSLGARGGAKRSKRRPSSKMCISWERRVAVFFCFSRG